MNVQSLAFLAFLTVTVCVCRLLPKERTWVLLAASLVFYLWGRRSSGSVGVRTAGGVLSCQLSRGQHAAKAPPKKRPSCRRLLSHRGIGVFKYTGFFTGGAVRCPSCPWYQLFHFPADLVSSGGLCRDLFTGPHSGRIPDLQLLFPHGVLRSHLEAGEFLPPAVETSPLPQDTAAGLYAIGLGLAKKVLLADNLGVLVNNGWSSLSELTALTAWCVILGYTLQLYFDFSGYCDLAAGCAGCWDCGCPSTSTLPTGVYPLRSSGSGGT